MLFQICLTLPNRRQLLAAAYGLASTLSSTTLSSPASAVVQDQKVEAKSKLISVAQNGLPQSLPDNNDSPLNFIAWKSPKMTGLNTEKMCDAINDGLREREWFVTGKGLPALFKDDFFFSDPQVSVMGFEEYCRSVRRLFDQNTARCEIICCSVTAPNTITVLWRNSGRVNLGPGIELKPYVVTTTLKTDPVDGLIVSQEDTFASAGIGLVLYQIPFLRSLTGPSAPPVEILREQCDLNTCKIKGS